MAGSFFISFADSLVSAHSRHFRWAAVVGIHDFFVNGAVVVAHRRANRRTNFLATT